MLDPFPPPSWVLNAVRPLTNALHLHTMTLHFHEMVFSCLVYNLIDTVLAPYISTRLLPSTYPRFPARTKLQWNLHVTSLVNSTFLSLAIPYILLADKDRLNETWEERMWGYTGAGGLVQALGAGYFLWDVQVCAINVGTLGVLDLLHAVVGLCVTILGFVFLSHDWSCSRKLTHGNSGLLVYTTEYNMVWSSFPPLSSISIGSSTKRDMLDQNFRFTMA
jgi:hypothetical protein